MTTIQFRAQFSSDIIIKVEECFNDNDGAYQLAYGFDANGNEVKLCNRGFSTFPN